MTTGRLLGGPARTVVPAVAGSATGLAATPTSLAAPDSSFGSAIGFGDVSGDGVSELFVSANYYMTQTGAVYLYQGRAGGFAAPPTRTFVGPDGVSGRLGWSLVL